MKDCIFLSDHDLNHLVNTKERHGKKKKRKKMRGTDEPFLRLMGIGGPAILKLLGIAPLEAEKYIFRSVVLKKKRMEPDTEAIPLPEGMGR
ncbi:MAG: hypothetical protein GY729_13035 [Desulfobacteraceae bacterium]|nr:hypothetical protein [Desulfobacteraceae bacterium]